MRGHGMSAGETPQRRVASSGRQGSQLWRDLRLVRTVQDAAKNGHPERGGDLLQGSRQGRARAGLRWRDGAEDDVEAGGEGHADADAENYHCGRDQAIPGVGADPGETHQGGGSHRQPGRYIDLGAQPGREDVADNRTDDHAADQRQQLDPGGLRIVTQNDLDVRRKNEHHAEQGETRHHERHRRPGEAAATEVAEVDEGRRMAHIPEDKYGQDRYATDDPSQYPWVAPTMDRLLDDPIDEGSDADHGEDSADPIEGSRLRILAFRDQEPHAEQRNDHDRRVDQENGSPGVMGQQPAGDQRAKREAEEGAGRRDADGARPFLCREKAWQDRQGERHDEGGSDAHECAHGDQGGGRCRLARDHRCDTEDGEPGEKQPPTAVAVAQDTGRKQETPERQGICGGDPLKIAGGRPQLRG